MKFFKTVAVLLYMLVFLLVGGGLITLSLDLISPEQITKAANYISSTQDLKLSAGIVGIVLILVGLLTARMILGRMQSEKNIAFDNPDGQVSISLSAIEDFVKKIAQHMREVKELKSSVVATKKGIHVVCRAIFFSDSNIPEVTEKVQATIKTRVQEMLGLEEPINVKIHVIKIAQHSGKEEGEEKAISKTSRHLPFRGME